MKNSKIPSSYWVISIIALLWNIMGIFSFISHNFISDETLAELEPAEQNLYDQYPLWTIIVYFLAVWGGVMGSIGLMARRNWARHAFLVSLLAVVPQMMHVIFFTDSVEVYGTAQAVTMPILVMVFAVFFYWFSNYAYRKKWLSE